MNKVSRIYHKWFICGGLIPVFFGSISLLGWVIDLPLLKSFDKDLIPMAPSTAILFIWYGTGVFLAGFMLLKGLLGKYFFWISCFLILISSLILNYSSQGVYSDLEYLGMSIEGDIQGAPVGHMSPVTALCFIFAGFSFLGNTINIRTFLISILNVFITSLLFLISIIFLVGYFIDAPFLYGGIYVPPALNTVLSFLVLSIPLYILSTENLKPEYPAEKFQRFYLFQTIVLVGFGIATLALFVLYEAFFDEKKAGLIHDVKMRALEFESVARFDMIHSRDFPGGHKEATISQFREAHDQIAGSGKTGEYTLAKLEGDQIVYLLSHRHKSISGKTTRVIPFRSPYAEPMRKALKGESGTIIGLDYRGETVLAAYEPIKSLNLGIVEKIDIAEIRAPFLRAAIVTGFGGIIIVVLGSMEILRSSEPLIRSIQEGKKQLDSVLEGAEAYFWDWDIKEDRITFDARWIRAMGYTPDKIEPTKRQWELLVHPEDLSAVNSIRNNHVQGKTESYEAEYRMLSKSGNWVWIFDRGKVLEWDNHGKPLRAYGTFLNISRRKKTEEKLAYTQKQLAESQKLAAIGELSAGVSHEVLNPLNIISVQNQLLGKKYRDNEKLQTVSREINYEIERIRKIIVSLLEFSRKGEPKLEKGFLREDIEKVLSIVENEYKLDTIKIDRNWCGNTIYVSYDADKMRQVFLNLCNNAKYAMPDGGTISVGSKTIRRDEKEFHQFIFSDTGQGMSEEVRQKVFDPFFTTKPEGEGTGMGLSVVHGIIEEHGGQISVESEKGKGTKFLIDLPIAD